MKVIYNKYNGCVERIIQSDQNPEVYFKLYPKEFTDKLSTFEIDVIPRNYMNCKIVNNEFVEMSEVEENEMRKYGRILTEEERDELPPPPIPPPTETEILKEQVKELQYVIDILIGGEVNAL